MAGPRPAHPGLESRSQGGGAAASRRVMASNGRLAVGLVQMDPALGDRARNLERHRQWARQAGEAGVELLGFPELSLTGYFLQDLVPESAIPLEGAVTAELRSLSRELHVV